jgi:DNA-binding ferritin-like protein
MTTKEDLQRQIDELRERLDALTGKPPGPITYAEAERDMKAGNKRTMERFLDQLAKGGRVKIPGSLRTAEGVSGQTN